MMGLRISGSCAAISPFVRKKTAFLVASHPIKNYLSIKISKQKQWKKLE
jgi:hypothetical protein